MDREDKIMQEYRRWLGMADWDSDMIQELKGLEGNAQKIQDSFYRSLAFGTGGLRGVIGAGTNRMNVYTVAKATQGFANYLTQNYPRECRKVAISFDSRIKSDVFARTAAEVLAANGISVYLYKELMPTPCLSYAVRELECAGGIMVTASHNPAQYNGYKVYGPDGGQITDSAAAAILKEIESVDVLSGAKRMEFESGRNAGLIQDIPEKMTEHYIEAVKALSLTEGDGQVKGQGKGLSIVYSPLNGTGLKPVLRCLRECGFTDITLVEEQAYPDGHFPTCPYPNPEEKEAMELGLELARRTSADLLLATDPDCDRVGIAVRDSKGEYRLLSGNETGVLLLEYICCRRQSRGDMPAHPVMVKTIVTTDMADAVAADYGVETYNVLTGFKYIGEQIGRLEKDGLAGSYILGFEESYGYLSGTHVRDKDAVNGALLICEMCAYYKEQGVTLLDKLEELYQTYGYWRNSLQSFQFEGAEGALKMKHIMEEMRNALEEIAGHKIVRSIDFAEGIHGLPKADVVKFILDDKSTVVLRPSGTEPKLKVYISACSKTKEESRAEVEKIAGDIERKIERI